MRPFYLIAFPLPHSSRVQRRRAKYPANTPRSPAAGSSTGIITTPNGGSSSSAGGSSAVTTPIGQAGSLATTTGGSPITTSGGSGGGGSTSTSTSTQTPLPLPFFVNAPGNFVKSGFMGDAMTTVIAAPSAMSPDGTCDGKRAPGKPGGDCDTFKITRIGDGHVGVAGRLLPISGQ